METYLYLCHSNISLLNYFKIKSFSINFILSFGIILLIELFQYIFKVGVFDVDDLIICTLGMMLFYVFYIGIKKRWFILNYLFLFEKNILVIKKMCDIV